jgi:heat-inducible transcriptional repressor
VGEELEHPDLRRLALVGAAYGLANRTLGAVSLLGPVRMDYEKAIRSVRGAASELSRFVEEIYERN